MIEPAELAERVRAGDRRALARAITLVESGRADHARIRHELLDRLLPTPGSALRVGITGTPGAGKSTFIEALGRHVLAAGERIAVLAVDPSSRRSGGSILGDKTRMQELAADPRAFIRPSPAGRSVGGVARRTREASFVVEAAGYDVVLIETVGVGQSEVQVADMVDCFVLLLAPGAGDELQGIKRGIVELADLVVINKADGELRAAAEAAATAYRQALQLLVPTSTAWSPVICLASAIEDRGVDRVLDLVRDHRRALDQTGELERRRARQREAWFEAELERGVGELLMRDAGLAHAVQRLRRAVRAGELSPASAAETLFASLVLERRRGMEEGR